MKVPNIYLFNLFKKIYKNIILIRKVRGRCRGSGRAQIFKKAFTNSAFRFW
jgi:hypothetical protein